MANNLHLLGKTTALFLCLILCLLQSSVTLGKKEKDERECEGKVFLKAKNYIEKAL